MFDLVFSSYLTKLLLLFQKKKKKVWPQTLD